jgi:tRNA-binding protein
LTGVFGDHKRSIPAGIRRERRDAKTEIEGRQALFVVNLEPGNMAGQVPEGMLFNIGHVDRISPVLAFPEKFVPNAARAG